MLACPRCGSSYSKDQEYCGIDGERLRELSDDPMIGRTIDRYTITAPLGEGGMARVYRARHTFLEQDFAVKILFGDLASDKNVSRRFQREAQAASKLKHPNVVSTIDMGQSKEGLIFMAMELLEGRTLTEVIREEGAMAPARAAFMARQIAAGLAAAHALGYVHRDLKPKNIMMVLSGGEEILKILDFGLVLMTDEGSSAITDATNLTRQGQVFGTPAYMAPEQCTGQKVGPAADLYALGVILYQLLSGSVPFGGAPHQIALHHLSTPPPPLPSHDGLGPLAMKLLAKKPADRPASAVEVVAALDAIFPTTSTVPVPKARQPSPPPIAWTPARKLDSLAPESLSFPGEISLTSERAVDFDDDASEAIERGPGVLWVAALCAIAVVVALVYFWRTGMPAEKVAPPAEKVAPPAEKVVVEPPKPPVVEKVVEQPKPAIVEEKPVEEPKPTPPPPRVVVQQPSVQEDDLERALTRLGSDLEVKLERARKILGELPESKKGARYKALVARYNSIRSRVLRARSEDIKEQLAAEITALEADALLFANETDGTVSSTAVMPF